MTDEVRASARFCFDKCSGEAEECGQMVKKSGQMTSFEGGKWADILGKIRGKPPIFDVFLAKKRVCGQMPTFSFHFSYK